MDDDDRILAFRLARSGLGERSSGPLAAAVRVPASDFSRDAALLAVAARRADLTRATYDAAVDDGSLVVAHVVRGAIHALDPADHALWGRALLSRDDDELAAQLGRQVQGLLAEHGLTAAAALAAVADATKDAIAKEGPLDRVALHEAYRSRVREELLPWCKGCKSHHVAPMLWRYATVKAGVRLDARRRYVPAAPGRAAAADALRRYLGAYGPATSGEFADWAGLAKPHATRIWGELEDELTAVGPRRHALAEDVAELMDPPALDGVHLLPPGDPALAKPNRKLVAPDADVHKRLFRPVASPGAVLKDGGLVALWRVKAKGNGIEVAVEKVGRVAKGDLTAPVDRVAALRGAATLSLTVS